MYKNNKARHLIARLCYIEWVSKYENQIPSTILKRISANRKKISTYFINIFFWRVDKAVRLRHKIYPKNSFSKIYKTTSSLFCKN